MSTALRTYYITALCVLILKILMKYNSNNENKDRKKDFHDAGLSSPPDPVIKDEQLGLELPYVTVFQLFVPFSTIGQVQVS